LTDALYTGTPTLYAGFSALVTVLLLVDFALLKTQGNQRVSPREAGVWSVIWVAVAGAFGAWLYVHLASRFGPAVARERTVEYFTGYVIEKGLAVENVFVWITIFRYFQVPAEFQKRVLLWGVVGAIVMRAVLIYLGALLIARFSWVFYVFGAFLLLTGIKMFFVQGKPADLAQNPALQWMRARFRVTPALDGERFFVQRDGVRYATPLLLVLALVELTDLIFALDSIPAIFAVTQDPFIVFTANTFAILGLRAMYFLLADMADRFHLLGYGLALIVTLVGAKMLLMDVYKIPIPALLGAVGVILVGSVVASLFTRTRAQTGALRTEA
jgi:tellurite resistance protein TerC